MIHGHSVISGIQFNYDKRVESMLIYWRSELEARQALENPYMHYDNNQDIKDMKTIIELIQNVSVPK